MDPMEKFVLDLSQQFVTRFESITSIAEEMGFEPMVELPPRQFSKLVPSAARSPLHGMFTTNVNNPNY